ncbi:MAG: SCO family protein [Chthoniobacteraceae bacterium]
MSYFSSLLVLVVLLSACSKKEPLPKYWMISPFKLTDSAGQPFDSASLKGKVWVSDFFFASCPGSCPILSSKISALHQEFAGEDRVRFVSITTDPAHDTPAVLQEYSARFKADPRWIFLTGEKERIWQLSKDGFKLAVADAPGEKEIIAHSTRLVLIDQNGATRGFYDGIGDERPHKIADDIRRLLAE